MAIDLEEEWAFSNYDDKNNPFQGNLIFALYMDGFYFFGKNNVGTINDKWYWDGELVNEYTINQSYQYNEQGFPIQNNYSGHNDQAGAITITYDCD